MNNLATLQTTIALYCRDLLKELAMYEEIRFDGRGLAAAVDSAMRGEFDISLVAELHRHLERASAALMSVYSRNPGVARFQQLYARAQSITEMCLNLMNDPGMKRR
ncbi:MAG: hypothetical protein JXA20_06430 [Spirochaetes bacterium]|nr:hypothetical protein [Spirochaetota bacterium]